MPIPPIVRLYLHNIYLWALGLCIVSYLLLIHANPLFLRAIAVEDRQEHELSSQPYTVKSDKDGMSKLRLSLKYTHGKNATIIIEPDRYIYDHKPACIEHIRVIAPAIGDTPPLVSDIDTERFCDVHTINFTPYLREGTNWITLQMHTDAPQAILYVSPQLFGAESSSTLACLGLFAAAALLFFGLLRSIGIDTPAATIAIAGLAYDALWIHLRPNLAYTADVPGHILYTIYMAGSWLINPYLYSAHENFHPPTYYFLAARIFNLSSASVIINVLTGLRMFSLALYMVFCLYGLRTLNEAIRDKGLPYYVGVFLMIFWPMTVDTASNISNDILIYSLWAMIFYHLVRWLREGRISDLQLAVILTGIAFTTKALAWVILGIVGSGMLYALCAGSLHWRQLLRGKSLMAFFVLLLGIIVNFGRVIYTQLFHWQDMVNVYFSYPRSDIYPFSYYVHFNVQDFIIHPFARFLEEPDFWNYFLKTWLYSPFTNLSSPPSWIFWLPGLLNFLLIVLLAIIFCGTCVCLVQKRSSFKDLYPHLVGVGMSAAGIIGFTVVDRYQHCQNFRYVLPMMVPLIVLLVRGMEATRLNRRTWPLYGAGIATGISLPVGAFILYISKYSLF